MAKSMGSSLGSSCWMVVSEKIGNFPSVALKKREKGGGNPPWDVTGDWAPINAHYVFGVYGVDY